MHGEVLQGLAAQMDADTLEAFARAELAALEAGRSPAQRVEKRFAMREACLRRLVGLEEAFATGELDEAGRLAVRAEARRRLADLSRLTLLLVEALAAWSAFVDAAARAAGLGPQSRTFCFDDERIDVFDTLFTDATRLSRWELFAQEDLSPDDLFFAKLLPPAPAPGPGPHDAAEQPSEEQRRRAW